MLASIFGTKDISAAMAERVDRLGEEYTLAVPDFYVCPLFAVGSPARMRMVAVVQDFSVLVSNFNSSVCEVDPSCTKRFGDVKLCAVVDIAPAIQKLNFFIEQHRERSIDIDITEICFAIQVSVKVRQ